MLKNKLGKLILALGLATSFVLGPSASLKTVEAAPAVQQSQEDKEVKEAIDKLEKAVRQNKVTVRACSLLLDTYPHLVESVRPELESLLEDSKNLQAESQVILDDLYEYLGR